MDNDILFQPLQFRNLRIKNRSFFEEGRWQMTGPE